MTNDTIQDIVREAIGAGSLQDLATEISGATCVPLTRQAIHWWVTGERTPDITRMLLLYERGEDEMKHFAWRVLKELQPDMEIEEPNGKQEE